MRGSENGICFSLLLASKVLSLSMHLSPLPCKKLLIVPSDWLVASILLFSVVPTLNEAHRHRCADGLIASEIECREQIQVGERFDYGLTPDIMAAGG